MNEFGRRGLVIGQQSKSLTLRYPSGVSVKFDLVVISIAGLIQVLIEIVYSHQLWNKRLSRKSLQKFTDIHSRPLEMICDVSYKFA